MSNNVNNKIALGTASLDGIWGLDCAESEDTILFALESGINHFDTSPSFSNAVKYLEMLFLNGKEPSHLLAQKQEN